MLLLPNASAADVAVDQARSAAAESCPAGESCMLLMLGADAAEDAVAATDVQ